MMNKLLIIVFIILFTATCFASQVTTNYNMLIPAEGDRDWLSQISNDIISTDAILNMLSEDVGTISIISDDVGTLKVQETIISDDVGRHFTILSGDAVIQDEKATILSSDAIVAFTSPMVYTASTRTISIDAGGVTSGHLEKTAVTAGSFTNTDLTVDRAGRITAASNGSAAGTPGGNDTQVQFNDSDSFGGDSSLVWNKTDDTLTISTSVTDKSSLIVTSTGVVDVADNAIAKFSNTAAATTEPVVEINNNNTSGGSAIEVNLTGDKFGVKIQHTTNTLANANVLFVSSDTANTNADTAVAKFTQKSASATEPAVEVDFDGTAATGAVEINHAQAAGVNISFAVGGGDSGKTVGTDAPADWIHIKIGGTDYYIPVWVA